MLTGQLSGTDGSSEQTGGISVAQVNAPKIVKSGSSAHSVGGAGHSNWPVEIKRSIKV